MIKYIHSDPEYVPQQATNNSHHEIWLAIKLHIDNRGWITSLSLDSYCLKYGKGSNKGNTRYAEYLIRRENIVVKEAST
jgi:hypothetical protein